MNRHINTVLITNFYADFGGGEFALLNHAKWLLGRGVEVHVCLFNDGPFVSKLAEAGCQVHVIKQRLDCGPRGAYVTALRLVPQLMALFLRIRPAYIVVHTIQEMPFVAFTGRLCRIPVIYRDQGRPTAADQRLDWRQERFPWIARRCLAGVVSTTKVESDHITTLGVPPEKVRQVYLGVDADHFQPTDQARQGVELEFGIPHGAGLIGMFGRLIELKGHDVLLDAMSGLGANNTHALMVGGTQLNAKAGPQYVHRLKRKAKDLTIADQVHFTGFRTDLPRLMSACDIICNASQWETFGLALVEGMFCGKPVVASDVTGPREIVVPGQTGFLFPVGDYVAMAGYLDRLLRDPDLRERMGQNGRRRACKLFDMDKNLQLLDDTIRGFIGQGR